MIKLSGPTIEAMNQIQFIIKILGLKEPDNRLRKCLGYLMNIARHSEIHNVEEFLRDFSVNLDSFEHQNELAIKPMLKDSEYSCIELKLPNTAYHRAPCTTEQ